MSKNAKGMLLMLLCPTIWSLSGLVAKFIPWPGPYIAGWRGLLSGLVIYIYMRAIRMKPVFTRRTFVTGLTVTATLLLYFASLKKIPAANAVALQYTEPVFLMLLSAIFLKKKYRRADYIVVAVALLGVTLLLIAGGRGELWGGILALLSGLCYGSTYFFMTDRSSEEMISSLLIGNTLAFMGIFTTDPRTLPVNGAILTVMLLSGLFQISVPHIIMTYAMRMTTPLACSLIATLEMVLNPVWVFVFLGERPKALSIVGAAVIMLAVVLWCVYAARTPTANAQNAELEGVD